jgi:ParB family chromosome partitioning protein
LVGTEVREISVDCILADPQQPRKVFLDIEILAKDIEKHGLLSSILVRPLRKNQYMIIHGERRFKAISLLGWKTIRCEIRDMSEAEVRDVQLSENLQRDELSSVELGLEFQRRIDQGQTHREIAASIHKDHSFVTQRLALLNLPKEILDKVLRREWTFSQARQYQAIKDEKVRKEIANKVTSDTTTAAMRMMVKDHERSNMVTHVTMIDQSVEVKKLATYQLLTSHETVSQSEFRVAVGQDLRVLRGQ